MSEGTNERAMLSGLWDTLGIDWTDETGEVEDLRREYSLPQALRIGSVFGGPGRAHFFFDADGRYVGYGATDFHEMEYFVERGRQESSFVGYDLLRDAHEVRLEGRYAGLPKVHTFSGNDRLLKYFHGLPVEVGNVPYTGSGDLQEYDVLDVQGAVAAGRYLVTRAEPISGEKAVRIDASRITRSTREDVG